MNKKFLSLCLLISTAASSQLCALTSLSEILENPEIAKINPAMKEPATREMIKKSYIEGIENPYNTLNKKYGDEATLKLEEQMAEAFNGLFLAAADGKLDQKELDELLNISDQFIKIIKAKKGITETEAAQFYSLTITNRMTVAGLEFSLGDAELSEKLSKKLQEFGLIFCKIGMEMKKLFVKEFPLMKTA